MLPLYQAKEELIANKVSVNKLQIVSGSKRVLKTILNRVYISS